MTRWIGIIAAVLVVVAVALGLFGLVSTARALPKPEQPIEFPHNFHVTAVGLDCTFCHRNVTQGAAATLPAVEQCMFCHQVAGIGNPRVEVLRSYWARQEPVNWVRVHRVPDHVHFVHEPHIRVLSERFQIAPTQVCITCHGDVANTGYPLGQVRRLDMGDCIGCHRQPQIRMPGAQPGQFVASEPRGPSAPTDCWVCHY